MYFENRDIKNKITRFIAGDCSADEQRVISGLIQSNAEYKKIFEEMSGTWKLAGVSVTSGEFDVNGAWEKVSSRMEAASPVKVNKPVVRQMPVRGIGWYAMRVAAVLIIGLAISQFFFNRSNEKTFTSGTTTSAPLSLSDGSTIFLNSASTIKFPEKFGGNNREVYFWGEAFFEIAHDPSRPFIIESGDARIKVLGTSFNVKAYPESNRIEVVVNSGKVLFYHVDKSDNILGQVTLTKGEKGIFDRITGQIARLVNDEPNYLSWKTGVLVFSETSLDKVLGAIGQKYGVTFSLADKDLCQLKLTATFDNESLDSVLEVLKLVHNLQFVNNGKDYLVNK